MLRQLLSFSCGSAMIEDRLGFLSFTSTYFALFSTFNALFAFSDENHVLDKCCASSEHVLVCKVDGTSRSLQAKSPFCPALEQWVLTIHQMCSRREQMETPVDVLTPMFFFSAVYWALGLNPKLYVFLLYTTTLILNVFVGRSVGLLMSALFMKVRNTQVLNSMWILCCMLISGHYIAADNIPAFV
eukprot:TRINITY_DN1099_c1_g4_i1.p1 TRINITY_DN1099_c1_g4~~TRINITY_DN1099_c1_g4_i1.p1  ORF type:complete len:186 (+),score=13.87 TRINITY_DN1099_c1_g4_i1:47-604(+)